MAVERFSTRAVEPAVRLNYWNELAEATFSTMSVDSPNPAFRAEMLRWQLGDLVLTRPRSEASVVHRARNRRGEDSIILHLQHRGRSVQLHRGSEAQLQPGDFSLCASSEPYRLSHAGEHEVLVVELPHVALAGRVPDLNARIARPVRGTSAGARVFHDFLLSLWQQGDQSNAEESWQSGISAVFLDLLALALRGSGATQPTGRRSVDQLVALTEARLSDPELRTGALADELGISIRSVQNLFGTLGTTPGGYILKRRLERAAERLAADPSQSITAIAFDLGFNDSAYFTRCFRQAFGMPPSAWRARH